MSDTLPQAVATYFEVSNGADISLLMECFTPCAMVTDEAKTHQGREAIVAWKTEAKKKFDYSVKPLGVMEEGGRVSVTARVVGNFTGSPVDLEHVFWMSGDRIKSLEIR